MENNTPRGPEDVPPRFYVKEHWIVILIIDVKSGRKIREEKVNFSDREVRSWIGRITYWATTNGYEVRTCNVDDYVVEKAG